MPKIIKNGKEFSGVPLETLTAWPDTGDRADVAQPLMGNTSLSGIGDGTVTGAIHELGTVESITTTLGENVTVYRGGMQKYGRLILYTAVIGLTANLANGAMVIEFPASVKPIIDVDGVEFSEENSSKLYYRIYANGQRMTVTGATAPAGTYRINFCYLI